MRRRFHEARRGIGLALAAVLLLPAHAGAQSEVEALRAELESLQSRLGELEALRERVVELEAQLEALQRTGAAAAQSVGLEEAGDPAVEERTEAPARPIEIGGALRFTAFDDSFGGEVDSKRGEAGLDLFRVNADGTLAGIDLSAEYRFYPYMQTIHHGWIGYDFEDAGQIQGGITQVPFGLLPYASHNFWFDIPYYAGLSDDYDLGVKYVHSARRWNAQVAFFKNAELNDASNLGRYAYDVISTGPDGNEEVNQLNARLAYRFGDEAGCTVDAGASAMRGELFNAPTGETGERWASAVHADMRCGRWNLQGQLARYDFDPRNPPGAGREAITVGAFEGMHALASRGDIVVANVAYNFPVRWPAVDQLTCYNDYSRLDKAEAAFDDSQLNVTGCLIGLGPTYTYIDVIRGKNMVFLGDGSLAGGGSEEWETRVNLNFGYYF